VTFDPEPEVRRYEDGQAIIASMLAAVGLDRCEHVVDYGGRLGGWVWALPRATVIEVDEEVIAAGRLLAEERGYPLAFVRPGERVEAFDGMLCLIVTQLMTGREIRRALSLAQRLPPGGRALVTAARPALIAEWLLRLQRIRIDNAGAPLWRRLATQRYWLRYLMRSAWRRRLGDDEYPYCLRRSELTSLARDHGFLVTDVSSLPAARAWERLIEARQSWWRHYTWLVLEQPRPSVGKS
jgi:hypothetical protein